MATLDAYTPQNVGPIPPWVSLRVLRQAYMENPEAFTSTELETYKALADYYGVPFDIQTSARRAIGNFLFNLADAALLGLLPDSIRDSVFGRPLTGAERFAAGLGDLAGLFAGVGVARAGLRAARKAARKGAGRLTGRAAEARKKAAEVADLRRVYNELIAAGDRARAAEVFGQYTQRLAELQRMGLVGRYPEYAGRAAQYVERGLGMLERMPEPARWTIAGLLGLMQPFEGSEY